MTALKSFQQKYTPLILQELESFFDEQLQRAKTKDQVLVDTVEVLKEFTLRGGKRIRPLMVILGYQLAGGTDDAIIRAACAVETHHHYLLNLDDMADRDILRHGGKTLEEYYRSEVFQDWPDKDHHGQTFASVNGALLNSYTFELLGNSGFSAHLILDAQEIVTNMLFSDTVVGWQLQYFQNNQDISEASEEQFMKGLEYVTSRYTFVGPMLIGLALTGVKNQAELSKLSTICTQYGKHVGIAFQIQDDILGLYGDPKEMGKAVGNDVREGKKTLLLQYAYRHGNAKQQKVIEQALNQPLTAAQLKEVQEVVEDTGSLLYSRDLTKKHVEEGIRVLDALPDSEQKQVLIELAQYMINRAK